MSYKIERVAANIYVFKPKHWWSILRFKDFISALAELADVVTIVRFRDWWDTKYIIVTKLQT